MRNAVIAALLIALAASLLYRYSSTLPDGLESSASMHGFTAEEEERGFPGGVLGNSAGIAAAFAAAVALGHTLRRRKRGGD